jgi:hypothetical protein
MSHKLPNLDRWPTKQETAQVLRCSEKTVNRLVKDGSLQKAVRDRAGLPPVVILNPDDVQREKLARDAARDEQRRPGPFAMPGTMPGTEVAQASTMSNTMSNGTEVAHASTASNVDQVASLFARIAAGLPPSSAAAPPHQPDWLTLPQAAELSGYPAAGLAHEIRCGRLPAKRLGPPRGKYWLVHREDLRSLRGERHGRAKTKLPE